MTVLSREKVRFLGNTRDNNVLQQLEQPALVLLRIPTALVGVLRAARGPLHHQPRDEALVEDQSPSSERDQRE